MDDVVVAGRVLRHIVSQALSTVNWESKRGNLIYGGDNFLIGTSGFPGPFLAVQGQCRIMSTAERRRGRSAHEISFIN